MSEQCPFCRHDLPDGATVCHCGAEKRSGPLTSQWKGMGLIGWIAGIVLGFMANGMAGAVPGCIVGAVAGVLAAFLIHRKPGWVRNMHR